MVPTSIPGATMCNGMVKRLSSIHAMRCHVGELYKQLGLGRIFDGLHNGTD